MSSHGFLRLAVSAYLLVRPACRSPRGRSRSPKWPLAVLFVLLTLLPEGSLMAQGRSSAGSPFPARHPVPPLPAEITWLNTAQPLDWADLRGKFVLLDFWTYCCINCMHVLPELDKLERAYPETLVVIGVHSAKFAGERETENIREAILRYEIQHPVINDAQMRVWRQFGVSAWPTLVLIDPEGQIVWARSGEATFSELDELLRKALPHYQRRGTLDRTRVYFERESLAVPGTGLRFPGKVLADVTGDRLFIADSNHNRIVVATLDGQLREVIGSGRAGAEDGGFATASFYRPQGMALVGESLYVADTENHLLRRVDLKSRQVETIAGTGHQNRRPRRMASAPARAVPLNSPWDVWHHQEHLLVAMAGDHQIWRMDLQRGTIGPFAGNGREDIVDGPLLPNTAYQLGASSFAQPSGLSADQRWLYVADSEGSSIRAVPLSGRGEVQTVLGTADLPAARLFTFGDVDGPQAVARLQHPLGVAWYDGKLFVADTYNNKIKEIDPQTGRARTLVGDGQPGDSDDPPRFNEPGGLWAAAGKLYVADTNNHAIRLVELENGPTVRTLAIQGLAPPETATDPEPLTPAVDADSLEPLPPLEVNAPAQVPVELRFRLPPGAELNPAMPVVLETHWPEAGGDPVANSAIRLPVDRPLETEIAIGENAAGRVLVLTVTYYWCEKAGGLCRIGSRSWKLPLVAAEAPAKPAPLVLEIPLP